MLCMCLINEEIVFPEKVQCNKDTYLRDRGEKKEKKFKVKKKNAVYGIIDC